MGSPKPKRSGAKRRASPDATTHCNAGAAFVAELVESRNRCPSPSKPAALLQTRR